MGYTLRDQDDARTRWGSQAYAVTYGGKSMETSPLGYDRRMSATYKAVFQATFDVEGDPLVELSIPPYVQITGWSLPMTNADAAGATATITVAEVDGSNPVILAAALTALGAATLPAAAANVMAAENMEKVVTFAIASGAGTGMETIALEAIIVETAWK